MEIKVATVCQGNVAVCPQGESEWEKNILSYRSLSRHCTYPKLCNINLRNITLSNISKPWGTDVHSSNFIPYCHISLPYITNFVINANHHRSQPTPSHCAMCRYVEYHRLLLLLLMSLVKCWSHCHICHIIRKVKWSGPHQWR